MFGLFKSKAERTVAQVFYDQAVGAARAPVFYRDMGVPDTLDGRFDMIAVHVFAAMYRINAQGNPKAGRVIQALFDVMFKDIERSLREMGVGDLGVPKKVKMMMRAFNGRVHAYRAAIEGQDDLAAVVKRNIYGTMPDVTDAQVRAMADYVVQLCTQDKGQENEKAA